MGVEWATPGVADLDERSWSDVAARFAPWNLFSKATSISPKPNLSLVWRRPTVPEVLCETAYSRRVAVDSVPNLLRVPGNSDMVRTLVWSRRTPRQ